MRLCDSGKTDNGKSEMRGSLRCAVRSNCTAPVEMTTSDKFEMTPSDKFLDRSSVFRNGGAIQLDSKSTKNGARRTWML